MSVYFLFQTQVNLTLSYNISMLTYHFLNVFETSFTHKYLITWVYLGSMLGSTRKERIINYID